jgi:adiponectin receptor
MMDQFLVDMGRRLEMLETYGYVKFDAGVKSIHDTLTSVHTRCTEVRDAGRRRHKAFVDALDWHYRDALAKRDTLETKVQAGMKMMEENLAALEQRAYEIRDRGLGATAHEMLDSGIAYIDEKAVRAGQMVHEGTDAARRAKEAMKLKVEKTIELARKSGLVSYDALPEPWRVNPYIRNGYRFSETKLHCVTSCFRPSNEFVNIWSHAIGLVIVLCLAFLWYPSTQAFQLATPFDIFIAGCFFFAACKCLVCSTLWHAMSSICNQTLMEKFACVDYTGISLLVAASIMTTEYTAFYCEPVSRWTYMGLTFVLGVCGTILPWHPTFNRADMSWARVGFYVSLAATGFLPIAQLTYERGWQETVHFYSPITKSIMVYLIGALMYAAKIPERFLPGWFDYVGGSHNIWHFAVLGGILYHYVAMQSFFGEAYRRASATV